MSEVTRRYYLTYPAGRIREPLLCRMYDATKVEFNVRTASVSEQIGLIGLELKGEEPAVEKAVAFFQEHGVSVEPIALDIVAG